MIQRLKMIWRILRGRQVVVITESYGKLCYAWDARSIEDVFKCVAILLMKPKKC